MNTSAAPGRILVVDDEAATAQTLEKMVRHHGHAVVVAGSIDDAMERFSSHGPFDVVLTDLHLGYQDGLELLRRIQSAAPDVPVVLITGFASMASAMESIQAGAYDYIAKPPTLDALGDVLRRAVEKHRASVLEDQAPAEEAGPFESIAGRSPRMLDVFKTVARIAPGRTSVLILGESGTGKELVARALHQRSPRAEKRFVPVNVSAIPEGLLESELFGHVRGAFTGANVSRRGLFEEAHQGTLFLDEIGDLSMPLQAKLLRVLQDQRIKPVGGNEETEVDVRLVAATHRDPLELVRSGRFREDLYYRLNVVSVALPSLRERRGDIPHLLQHFLQKYGALYNQPRKRFSPEAEAILMEHSWPGNVRELANVVERSIVLSPSQVLTPDSLPESVRLQPAAELLPSGALPPLNDVIALYVARVLAHTSGNFTRAAQVLGISRRTLHRMAARRRDSGDSSSDA